MMSNILHIFCDFDGTISNTDTADFILSRFASPEWEEIEAQWKNGEIGSGECMRRQIVLINASGQELNSALDEVEIDADFPEFIEFCNDSALPFTIISDGVDYFIRHILSRFRLGDLPIIANKLVAAGTSSYELQTPNASPLCESQSGVCKCRMVGGYKNMRIYVGDGRSDFCVADKVDVIFAKDKLAVYCQQNNIAYIPYNNFADVKMHLQIMLASFTQNQPEYKIRAAI